MKKMSLYETKNRFSELCSGVVETGEDLLVTRRGKPFVRIVPVQSVEQPWSVWETVKESEAKYGPLDADFEEPEHGEGSVRPAFWEHWQDEDREGE